MSRSNDANKVTVEKHEDDEEVLRLRKRQRAHRSNVTLLKSPIRTMSIFAGPVALGQARRTIPVLRRNIAVVIVTSLAILGFVVLHYFVPGAHQEYTESIYAFGENALWWVMLGVLSSVGLGTGLHTFVLYLGPLIAKATLASDECGTTAFELYGSERFLCPIESEISNDPVSVSIWAILFKIQLEALLWGLGTAIGELPPYFVARAAAEAGKKLEDMQDYDDLKVEEDTSGLSIVQRAIAGGKALMHRFLGNLGFFGILAFASVPNPLFDLAGLTCGHFRVPFWTFFGATMIGKAFIKAHLQSISVIIVFSKRRLDWIVKAVDYTLPFLKDTVHGFIESEKAKFHRSDGASAGTKSKGVMALAWDAFLVIMLAYFIWSIIESSVQGHLAEEHERELTRLKEEKKKKAGRKSD